MVIKFKGKSLTKLLDDFVGNNKVLFNFKSDGHKLYVQVLDDYSICTDIDCESVDGDYTPIDISVWFTKFIHVLNSKEDITFTINDSVLFIEQSTFYCTLLKEYEGRKDFMDMSNEQFVDAHEGNLKRVIHCMTSCGCMAKELSIPDPDPVFSGGRIYADYLQSFYVDSIDYPEVCIPYSIAKSFVFKLGDNSGFKYLKSVNQLYFKSGDYEFWIPTTNYNIDGGKITAVNKKIAECQQIGTISFRQYKDKLVILSGAFPKQKMVFSANQSQWNIGVDSNNAHMVIGYQLDKVLLSINITSAQLLVITKLFGDDDEVEFLRGINCICLKKGSKHLLIAGMIY